jgi:hypothetical protein
VHLRPGFMGAREGGPRCSDIGTLNAILNSNDRK